MKGTKKENKNLTKPQPLYCSPRLPKENFLFFFFCIYSYHLFLSSSKL